LGEILFFFTSARAQQRIKSFFLHSKKKIRITAVIGKLFTITDQKERIAVQENATPGEREREKDLFFLCDS